MYRNNRTNIAILYGAIFSVITANVYSITREEIIKLNPVDLRKAFDKNDNLSGVSHHERNLLRTKLGILSDKDKILKLDKRLNAIGEQRDLIAQKFLETKGIPRKTASPRELMQLTLNRPALDVSKLSSSKLEEQMKNAETANAKYLRNVAKSTAGIIPGVSDVFTAIDIYQNGVDLEIPSFEEPKDWITMSNALAKIKIEQKIAKGSALKKVAGKMGHVATVSDVLLQSVNLVAEGHELSQSAKDDLMDSYRKGGSFFINSFAKKAIGSSSRYIKNHKVVGNGEMMKTIDAEMLADKKKMRGLLRDEMFAIMKAIKELSEDTPKGVGFKNKFQNSLVQMNDNTVSFVLKVLNQKNSTEVMMKSLQISLGILNGFAKDFDAIFRVQYEQVFYANLDRELEQLELKKTDDLVQSIQNFSAGIRQLPARRAIAINPESYLGGGKEKISPNVNTGILAKTKNEDTTRHEVVNSQHGGEAETPSTESPVTPTEPTEPTDLAILKTTFVRGQSGVTNENGLASNSKFLIEAVGDELVTRDATIISNGNALSNPDYGLLTGLTWGTWGDIDSVNGVLIKNDEFGDKTLTSGEFNYWIAGVPSAQDQSATLPTGTATYAGEIHGSAVYNGVGLGSISNGVEYQMTGDFTSTVDFSSSSISNRINNLHAGISLISPLSNVELTDTISNGKFTTSGIFNSSVYSNALVSFDGDFYGQNYDSLGGTILIDHPGVKANGVFVGGKEADNFQPVILKEALVDLNLDLDFGSFIAPYGLYTSDPSPRLLGAGAISSTDQENFTFRNSYSLDVVNSNSNITWGRWEGDLDHFSEPANDYLFNTNFSSGWWIGGKLTDDVSQVLSGAVSYSGELEGTLTEYIGATQNTHLDVNANDFNFYPLSGDISLIFQIGDMRNNQPFNIVVGSIRNLEYVKDGQSIQWIEGASLRSNSNTITANSFNLSVDVDGAERGFFNGNFFGIEANQVGGSFALQTAADSLRATGVFVGSRDQNPFPERESEAVSYTAIYEKYPFGSETIQRLQRNPINAGRGELKTGNRTTLGQNSHLSWGEWNGEVQNTKVPSRILVAENSRGYWIAGRITPVQNIPTMGSAIYDGELQGTARVGLRPVGQIVGNDTADFYPVTGNFQMNVNFETGSIGGQVTNAEYQTSTGRNVIISNSRPVGINGVFSQSTGDISASGSSFPNRSISVSMNGNFYGQNADAVGGTFSINSNFGESATNNINANGIFYSTSKTSN